MTTFNGYLEGVKALIDQVSEAEVARLTDLLYEAWKADRRVLLLGNGGSAGTASHIVNDLQKCVHLESAARSKALPVRLYAFDNGLGERHRVLQYIRTADRVLGSDGRSRYRH